MRLAPLALLFVVGCAEPAEAPHAPEPHEAVSQASSVKWHASTSFTAEERADILRGMRWLDEHSGHDSGDVAFDDEPAPYRIERDMSLVTIGVCRGWVEHVGGVAIVLNPPQADPVYHPLYSAMAHELAHCELGFRDAYWPSPVVSQGIMGNGFMPPTWTSFEDGELDAFNRRRRGE